MRLKFSALKMSIYLERSASFPRGGDSHMKQTGMLVGYFEFNP